MPRPSRVTLEMEIQIYEAKLSICRSSAAEYWWQCPGFILSDCQQFHFSLFRFKSLLGEISLGFASMVIKATISQGSRISPSSKFPLYLQNKFINVSRILCQFTFTRCWMTRDDTLGRYRCFSVLLRHLLSRTRSSREESAERT